MSSAPITDDHHFDLPVVIETSRVGKVRVVGSTREAAEVLLYRWPADHSSKRHRAARQACMDVLLGLKQARHARKAFADAAREADILIELDAG